MSEEQKLSTFPKDRSRQKQSQHPTRQSLGAVGRVASRVRTSGIYIFPTSLKGRAKEKDEGINASPWGVGIEQALEEREQKKDIQVESLEIERKREVSSEPGKSIFITSPLSARSRIEESVNIKSSPRKTRPSEEGEDEHGKIAKRQGEEKVVRVGSKPPSECDVITESDVDIFNSELIPTTVERKKPRAGMHNPGAFIKEFSKVFFKGSGPSGKRKVPTFVACESGSPALSMSPISGDQNLGFDRSNDLKISTSLHKLGHREKEGVKVDAVRRKSCLSITPSGRQDEHRNKNKDETSKGTIFRSRSPSSRTPFDNTEDQKKVAGGPKPKKISEVRKNMFSRSKKETDQKQPKAKSGWFGKSRENTAASSSETNEAQKQSKSKGLKIMTPNKIEEAGVFRFKKKKAENAGDFEIDKYSDSDDEIDPEAIVRSLVEDDFISYQTKVLKKKDRARNH